MEHDQRGRAEVPFGDDAVGHDRTRLLGLHAPVAVRGDVPREDQAVAAPLGLGHDDLVGRHASPVDLPRCVHVPPSAASLSVAGAPRRTAHLLLGILAPGSRSWPQSTRNTRYRNRRLTYGSRVIHYRHARVFPLLSSRAPPPVALPRQGACVSPGSMINWTAQGKGWNRQ